MFEMVIMLLIVSVIIEVMIVAAVPFLRDLLMHHGIISLIFSIVLSWILGTIFGAAGMIVFIAAIGSTLVTWFIYRIMSFFSWVARH